MTRRNLILLTFLTVTVLSGFDRKLTVKQKQLFNGKDLTGWDTYIGAPYDTLQKKFTGDRLGLNNDPMKVFSVTSVDGQPAIHISGERFGGISTKQEFHNYHLKLEFKWGSRKWEPKKGAKRDSGLLYHAVGEHGADGGFWMRSQEFQIQEGDCGDYWGVAGGVADVPAVEQAPKRWVYTPGSPLLTFSEKGLQGRNCIKNPDGEKPTGQWNTIELYCFGDMSIHIVNDVVTMVLFNSRQTVANAVEPLTSGKIQLQSEGAELYYRNIVVENISAIPKKYLH
ncbi:MAG TPA: DUF1080 domain-containing protein [Chryseolinea sp.]|nr:DUF1080 domain-containing protein [Chryseolinea sp.]